jgi:hypothetical protein
LAADDEEELFESYEKRIRDRLAAEEELDAFDVKRRERELEADYNLERENRFDRHDMDDLDQIEQEDIDIGADEVLNLDQFQSSLKDWLSEERTRREIFRRFKNFLLKYYEDMEQVQEWLKKHDKAPLPSHLRVKQPIYPARIRYVVDLPYQCEL